MEVVAGIRWKRAPVVVLVVVVVVVVAVVVIVVVVVVVALVVVAVLERPHRSVDFFLGLHQARENRFGGLVAIERDGGEIGP